MAKELVLIAKAEYEKLLSDTETRCSTINDSLCPQNEKTEKPDLLNSDDPDFCQKADLNGLVEKNVIERNPPPVIRNTTIIASKSKKLNSSKMNDKKISNGKRQSSDKMTRNANKNTQNISNMQRKSI